MPASSYTVATLTADVQGTLGDTAGAYFTSARILAFINLACAEWCERVKTRRHTWTVDLVADQAPYDLSVLVPRVIDIQDVAVPTGVGSTQMFSITKISMEQLDEDYPQWRTEPSTWPRRFTRSNQGFDGIWLHPKPASSQKASVISGAMFANQARGILRSIRGLTSADATTAFGLTANIRFLVGSMQLDGIAHSTDATQASDSLETVCGVEPQYQDAIRERVLAYCCTDNDVPIKQAEKGALHGQAFEARLARATDLVKSGFQSKEPDSYSGGFV